MIDKATFLIAGIINASNRILYWKNKDNLSIAIGDYAIVENTNGYDLVKVVGIVYTGENQASKFSNTRYDNMKSVVKVIEKELLEKSKKNIEREDM